MRSKKSGSAAKTISATFLTFLLAATLAAQPALAKTKFKVLHTFHGAPADGAFPWTQLTRDSAGNLYGTTEQGGAGKGVCSSFFNGCGTVFELDKNGKLLWLHSFNSKNGGHPMAGLVRDATGNLYGTTLLGGDTNCYEYGCGTVFKLGKTGKETVLHKFIGTPDGELPEALLVEDKAGNLYGTTTLGGAGHNGGTVFKVDKKGHETVLYSFCSETNCPDGQDPSPGVILDAAGNMYGAATPGGAYGAGVVYKLNTAGNETVLYSFSGGPDGAGPSSVLIADSAGNLYGTTQEGGNLSCFSGSGCGVVFELSPQSNGSWTETTLYTFCSETNCTDGNRPLAGPLVRDSAGNLYGTTEWGGTSTNCNGEGCGVVFKVDPTGKETVLHSFTLGADGGVLATGLIMDKLGNLYGVAVGGGDLKCAAGSGQGCGVVFELTR